ncbi:MAG: FtsX-like permease family protein [bacterium]
MRRSLAYYWRLNLAVVLAAAVATAVLTGALLVGDSVRGSLRDLTLARLGEIDYVLVRQKFLREDLLLDLIQSVGFEKQFDAIASAIFLNGNALHTQSRARASNVNLLAIDEQFLTFYASDSILTHLSAGLKKSAGQNMPSIVINRSLQKELQAKPGDHLLISFPRPSTVARGSLMGRKHTDEVVETVRVIITRVLPDRGVARFGLHPHQTMPLNAFISLPVLQTILPRQDEVNALLLSQRSNTTESDLSAALQHHLSSALTLDDLDLKMTEQETFLLLESRESLLAPPLEELIATVAEDIAAPVLPILTYLANSMRVRERRLPYSTVSALQVSEIPAFGEWTLVNGKPVTELSDDEILLNEWAAHDLRAQPGDKIHIQYYEVGPADQLITNQATFNLKGIVALKGFAVDSTLTPDYPGISDTDDMTEWDPPFAIDLNLIRPVDEAYWDHYRAIPKAFIPAATGEKLWGSRFGKVTSMRIAPAESLDVVETRAVFEKRLLETVRPEQFDYVFQPVKKQGLASSAGATDFSGLFFGFSLFLIVSAALLVGLMFRLGVERRVREIGTLLSVGFSVKMVRKQFLLEGAILAATGAVLGLGGAVFYAGLLMHGLRTWWLSAIGAPFLFLHVQILSLALGASISLTVNLVAIWLSFRKLSKVPPPALLAGVTTEERFSPARRWTKMISLVNLILSVSLTVAAFFVDASAATGLFFGAGAILLIASLSYFSIWLRSPHSTVGWNTGRAPMVRLSFRNTHRNPGRSLLSAALVASACFVIVAVEAFRLDFDQEVLQKDSGAGGFTLAAKADVPLHHDLSTATGRFELGFSDEESQYLQRSHIYACRYLPGDDASCLNLYRVEKPRLLGVPDEFIQRGGFRFQALASSPNDEQNNPWQLLNREIAPDVIPAFGDYNSVKWILHSGLGKDLILTDELGSKIKLRFMGLLQKSIFQSELLISENLFLKHFPNQSGYAYFLMETPPSESDKCAQILEKNLTDYGFDITSTADKLANFQAVENTYLSTFQTLGGLGLLLGTLGLGLILIRNVVERRGELATLRAFGYRHRTLAFMVLAENGFLLILGIGMGTFSAVIAVLPHIWSRASQVPYLSLAIILIAVFSVGMLASLGAVRAALKIPLLPALKVEG